MNEFKIGDVVCLKSGGENMCILETETDNQYVTLVWYNFTTGLFSSQKSVPTFLLNKVTLSE